MYKYNRALKVEIFAIDEDFVFIFSMYCKLVVGLYGIMF